MNNQDIIDLQLDSFFGNTMPKKIQSLVDTELNEGKWHDGYDIAVNPSGINESEGRELLDVVLSQHPSLRIDEKILRESIEKELPQSVFAKVLWMTANDGTFIVTDSLKVARYRDVSPLWVTPRISWDKKGGHFVNS